MKSFHRSASVALALLLCAPHLAAQLPPVDSDYQLVPAFTNLKVEKPISVVILPDGTNRLLLVQQRGKILILPKDESSGEAPVFFDISDRNLAAPKGDFEMG